MVNPVELLAEAQVHRRSGQLPLAEQCCRRALQMDPTCWAAHSELGVVLGMQRRLDEAIAAFQAAAAGNPNDAQTLNNLGVALRLAGRVDEAIAACRKATEARPDYGAAHVNLGAALRQQGQLAEAVACARRALQLKPADVEALIGLGLACERLNKLDEAAACFREALRLNPSYAEIHCNLAGVLGRQGRLDEATQSLTTAVALCPDLPRAHVNLGMVLDRRGNFDAALGAFRRALELDPNCAEAHLNYALGLLRGGNFEAGWREYEWRAALEGANQPAFPQPRWTGQNVDGKTVLLTEEQGRGDTLQFVRYAELIDRQGATVVVGCRPELAGLLKSCRGVHAVVPTGTPLPPFDLVLPMPSAPGVFRTSLASVPANIPYLSADASSVASWRQELNAPATFKIGIAWHGDPNNESDRYRSIPLAQFAGLSDLPGVSLFSLQMGPGREQLDHLQPPVAIMDLADRIHDFQDTAAIVSNLDLVIACDTAVVHLAGALGVPVWVAVAVCPDWRWMLGRHDSPWYPTLRLYRQSQAGDWTTVFQHIRRDLSAVAAGAPPSQ